MNEYGADVNITDEEGDTPLHVVETVECAKLLIELGADPKTANKAGYLVRDLTGMGLDLYFINVHGSPFRLHMRRSMKSLLSF